MSKLRVKGVTVNPMGRRTYHVRGYIKDDPRFRDGTGVTTSVLNSISMDASGIKIQTGNTNYEVMS
jgi:hypothetical protein